MNNLGQMMKQAQEMQAKMAELQEQLARTEVTGAAGGGMIRVTLNGKGEMRAVTIDPALVDPNEVGVLEDLIVAATNDAKAKAEAKVAEKMRELTGGLSLPPGFTLPM
ncbi:MAG: YbaB/EbfC family nucleoid-associated protein [Proteobacteria bacterium]|nr:YbaB/EbfC family nucleoid-associated protein [Pseudomonadota bacterium]